ncbi:hypothetical protein Nmel_008245 [Mimus melanotis]
MFVMYLPCQKQKAVALLMKQNLKNQANCPTNLCCCS